MTKESATVAAPTPDAPSFAPDPVQETLARSGRPLEPPVRTGMEARLGHDFSRVRVHTDAGAAASARAVDAQAYTVGSDVVFGAGSYAPHTSGGASLLAHELAHTVQQRDATPPTARLSVAAPDAPAERQADRAAAGERGAAAPVARATLMRRGMGEAISGLFAGETFTKPDLDAYLAEIDKSGAIQGFTDSDNKARAVVEEWVRDTSQFALTSKLKALLILEMLDGVVDAADVRAIMLLLNTADSADLVHIFGAGGVTPKALDSATSGPANDRLRVFLTSWFDGSIADILAGKGTLRVERTLSTPYQTISLPLLLQHRSDQIDAAVVRAAPADQSALRRDLARIAGEELAAEAAKQPPAESQKAIQDMRLERVSRNDVFHQVEEDEASEEAAEATDPANAAAHKANKARLHAENTFRFISITILDVALSGISADIALATPKAALAKQVRPLSAADRTAAQEAIQTTRRGAATFTPKLPGESYTYKEQLTALAPLIVSKKWDQVAKDRTAKEHIPANLHALADLEVMANAAAAEVDLVFGSYKKAPAFKADVFDAAGNVVTAGSIHDLWQSEEAQRVADATHAKTSATFWMFYLLENDPQVRLMNVAHGARPAIKQDNTGDNPEGSDLAAAANAELAIPSEVTRLFEIGRAWSALNNAGNVSTQVFRGATEDADRRFLWTMFFSLMHEYLHSLSAKRYDDLEKKYHDEKTDPGNTLIEGVDSYLTEIVWSHARPRASLPAVRDKVEPEYVKKGRAFDAALLPLMPDHRYANYDKAAKLVSIVGLQNLYAAYFLGTIEAIGQTLP